MSSVYVRVSSVQNIRVGAKKKNKRCVRFVAQIKTLSKGIEILFSFLASSRKLHEPVDLTELSTEAFSPKSDSLDNKDSYVHSLCHILFLML